MTPTRSVSAAFALFLASHAALPTSAQEITVFAPRDNAQDGIIMPERVAYPASGTSATEVLGWVGLGLAGLVLAAAGGGSDDSTSGPKEVSPPSDPSPPGPRESITRIEAEDEYRINPALRSARASHKYAKGLTGKGVRIGVLDTGIQDSQHLQGAVDRSSGYSPYGDDYRKDDDTAVLRHGTAVAQIIAGRRDGQGTYGLAYNATLVDLVVMNEDTDTNRDITRGTFGAAVQAGLNSGTRLFNASFGYDEIGPEFLTSQDAHRLMLQQQGDYAGLQNIATNQGVIVIATGNDSSFDPDLFASAGLLPEFSGHVLAVTAIDSRDRISGFATRCGVLKDYCLSAVGEDIPVFLANGQRVNFDGTSGATPVVTGSIALLHQEFPELSLPDTAKIVLDTARDIGAPGVDDVYGHGALDLGNALTAQGELRIAASHTVQGASHAMTDSVVRAKGALAYSLSGTLDDTDIMVYDAYTRGFSAELGGFVSNALTDSPLPDVDLMLGTTDGLMARSFGEDGTLLGFAHGAQRYSLGYGRADLFGAAINGTSIRKGYSPLAVFDDAANIALHTSGGATFGAHAQDGHGGALWANIPLSGQVHLGVGAMHEDGAVLGTEFSGAMGTGAKTTTAFVDISTTAAVAQSWTLGAQGLVAYTRFDQEGVFESGSLLSLSAEASASYADTLGNTWTGFVGTPLVLHGGHLNLDRPVDREEGTDTDTSTGVLRTQNRLSVGWGDAPIDLGLRFERDTQMGTIAATGGVRLHNGDHNPFAGLTLAARF